MTVPRRRSARIALDVGLLVGFVAEFVTREGPDYALHSWIGIVLIPLVALHLAGNWRWVVAVGRRRELHPEWPLARFNTAFSLVVTVCIVTGFPPWLGWSEGGAWVLVHNVSGLLAIVLAGSHLWRNRQRVVALTRRRPIAV